MPAQSSYKKEYDQKFTILVGCSNFNFCIWVLGLQIEDNGILLATGC